MRFSLRSAPVGRFSPRFAPVGLTKAAIAVGFVASCACVVACVKVPGEIDTQFAPKSALEDSHFQKRNGAPLAHTFLTSADMVATPLAAKGDAGKAEPATAVAKKESYGVPTAEELEAEHQQNMTALGAMAAPAPPAKHDKQENKDGGAQ